MRSIHLYYLIVFTLASPLSPANPLMPVDVHVVHAGSFNFSALAAMYSARFNASIPIIVGISITEPQIYTVSG